MGSKLKHFPIIEGIHYLYFSFNFDITQYQAVNHSIIFLAAYPTQKKICVQKLNRYQYVDYNTFESEDK